MDDNMDHFDPEADEEVTAGDGSVLWVWRGKGDPIKVEMSEFKGKHYLNVRSWYLPKDEGLDPENTDNYKPTKKGISVDVQMARKVIDAMNKVLGSALHED